MYMKNDSTSVWFGYDFRAPKHTPGIVLRGGICLLHRQSVKLSSQEVNYKILNPENLALRACFRSQRISIFEVKIFWLKLFSTML